MTEPPELPDRFERSQEISDNPLERTFLAHDALLARDVLIKLPGQAADGWTAPVKERLLREARALAKVQHPGIAPILWVEQTDSGPLCVLEPPAGERLDERLQRGPLAIDETVQLGIEIADALAAVHYQGIVHRAIRPAAIRILPSGRAQLGAFTFAKEFAHGNGSSLSHGKLIDGTINGALPEYPAPEQLAGTGSDPRSDIYALGCTLFRCLTGQDAFAPGDRHQVMPDLRKLRKDVPRALANVIRTCTMPHKTSRYATAQAVVDALRALPTDAPTSGSSRRAGLVATAAIVAIVMVGMLTRELWFSNAPAEDTRYEQQYGQDYARVFGLFIGIDKAYSGSEWRVLHNPTREITAVTAQLKANDSQWRRPGAIRILNDKEATFPAIEQELQRLARDAQPEDAVLVYFAGHGTKVGRSFALCAADVRGSVQNGTGYLRRDALITYLDAIQAKHLLVVIDCCHSGAVFEVDTMRGRDPDEVLKKDASPGAHHRQKFSREYLCSAAADEKASDGAMLSPFCELLLAQLRQPATKEQEFVAARYLSGHIAEAMDQTASRSGRMQVPRFRQMAEQEGSFVFRLAKGQ